MNNLKWNQLVGNVTVGKGMNVHVLYIGNPWELGMMANVSNSYENQTFVGKTTEQVVKELRKAGTLRTADSQ